MVVIALMGTLEAEFSPVHLYVAPLSLGSTRKTAGEKMGKWKKWKVIERGQLATGKLLMFI